MTQVSQQQQSISLVIQNKLPIKSLPLQPPQRQSLKDIQLILNTQSNRIDIYLTVNKIYLQNLINRRQKPAIKNQIRQNVGKDCIIYKEIKIDEKSIKQLYREMTGNDQQIRQLKEIKGNIRILHVSQINLQIKLYFKHSIVKTQDHIWLTIHYNSLGHWKSKTLQLSQSLNSYCWKIPISQLNDYIDSNFLINITLRKHQPSCSQTQFLGIMNLGNTCYMNSCLQMMYFLRPLRKIIIQSKSKKKLLLQIKQSFIKLMDNINIDQRRPIDIEGLLQSYDKFNQVPRRQHDVQEFLLDFINQLENQEEGLKNLWEGLSLETTFSKEHDKPYVSTKKQLFSQLDVNMFNHQGQEFKTIEQSLEQLLRQEQVDELIENDTHGKIKVSRVKRFSDLPDVLFINLKRYQFNKQKMRSVKLCSHIQYKQNLNIGFLLQKDTPGHRSIHGKQDPNYDYSLFSVIVHKGSSPQNGHYFSFVNTSNQPHHPSWYKFNDSTVRPSDSEQVLKFTGKKIKDIILDRKMSRFCQKQIQSDQSSYLLVYIKKSSFKEFQSIEVKIPQSYLKEKMKKKAQEEKRNVQDVNTFVLSIQKQTQIDIFADDLQYTPIPLNQDQHVISQLKKIDNAFLGCTLQKAYKVCKNSQKIKQIDDYDLVKQITSYKRGHFVMDYILIIPNQTVQNTILNRPQKMELEEPESQKTVPIYDDHSGVIQIKSNQFEDEIPLLKFMYVSVEQLAIIQAKVEEKGGQVNYLNDKQAFDMRWSSYLEIQIVRNQ